jgi:hypothetical protein
MRNDPTLRKSSPHRSPTDGWLGTLELPGYRAGNVVAKLDDLPEVDPHHLYFDLLLLDAGGHTQDNHSGPCYALGRHRSVDERSRFVRVVAELVRHAPTDSHGLSAIGQALSFIRERGVETDRLIAAAQLLDDVCSEHAVTASLNHMLELSLGQEEAQRTMCDVVVELARNSGFGQLDTQPAPLPPQALSGDFDSRVSGINNSGLAVQVTYVVRTVGKTRARHYLREVTDFELVPKPDMFGV